jgi:ABC-type transporter Mla subunit MlaD
MMERTGGLPTLERHGSRPGRWLFLWVFGVGSFLIVALKWIVHAPQLVVTSVPVGILCAYGSYLIVTKEVERDEYAGDSVYYLGFLYTLVSLALALVEYQSGGEAIVGNFGVALATTIAGLAGRIVILQMRRSPTEMEQQARVDLATAAYDLRKHLDSAVADMGQLHGKLRTTLEESLALTRETMAREVQDFAVTTTAIRGDLRTWGEESAKLGKRLNQACDRTISALTALAERAASVPPPDETIYAPIQGAIAKIAGAIELQASMLDRARAHQSEFVRAQEGLAKDLTTLKQTISETDSATKLFGANLGGAPDLSARFVGIGETLARLERDANGAARGLGDSAEALKGAVDGVRSASSELKQFLTEIEPLISAARQTTERMGPVLASLGESAAIAGDLKEFRDGLTASSKALVDQSAVLVGLVEDTRRFSTGIADVHQRLEEQARNGETMAKRLGDSLIEVADTMIKRLRE